MSTHTITVPDDLCKVTHLAGQYGAMTPDNPALWAVWEMVA